MIILRWIYNAVRFVIDVWKELDWPTRLGMAAFIAFIVFMVVAVVGSIKTNSHQKGLLATGLCESVTQALYTPPVRYQCASYNKDGGCSLNMPVQDSPYMRTLWDCSEAGDSERFWRRTTNAEY